MDSNGDKMLSPANQLQGKQKSASSICNNLKGYQEKPTGNNEQSSSGCDGDKTPPLANQERKKHSATSCDYNNGKGHQGKPDFNDTGTPSASDGDKMPPPTNEVQTKQVSTPYHPAFDTDANLPNDVRAKLRLLASKLRKGQVLVEDHPCNTNDHWYMNPPGTNIQITTSNFIYTGVMAYYSLHALYNIDFRICPEVAVLPGLFF